MLAFLAKGLTFLFCPGASEFSQRPYWTLPPVMHMTPTLLFFAPVLKIQILIFMIVLMYMIHNTLFQYRSPKMFEALCKRSLIILGSFLFGQYLNMTLLLQETLLRRTCKLVEFENASKSLEKAKPKNQEQVCCCFCKFYALFAA